MPQKAKAISEIARRIRADVRKMEGLLAKQEETGLRKRKRRDDDDDDDDDRNDDDADDE